MNKMKASWSIKIEKPNTEVLKPKPKQPSAKKMVERKGEERREEWKKGMRRRKFPCLELRKLGFIIRLLFIELNLLRILVV